MAKIDELFRAMVAEGASDLHVTSGAPPYLRVNGKMRALDYEPLTNQNCQALIFEILNEKHKRAFIEKWELDTSYHIPNLGRFRCNVFMQREGLGGVFRLIPEKIKTVQELNLPHYIVDLLNASKGLILVTGPTGSGKSTTLAAMIHEINVSREAHIITIEDPIEFVHKSRKSLINQREVMSHTKSFANALRSALREDPDIILVGELRDLETISLALTAAETGHLVLGTLHTNGASKTIDRIIDVFPGDQQQQIRTMLSESLRGIVAQTLFPTSGGEGRVPGFEVLRNNKAIANLIRECKTYQIDSALQTGRGSGMISFKQYIDDLLKKNLILKRDADQFLGTTD